MLLGGGISKGAILGIVFGIFGGTILIISIIYYFKWKVDKDFENKLKNVEMEEKSKNQKNIWKENQNHEDSKSTKWNEFQN